MNSSHRCELKLLPGLQTIISSFQKLEYSNQFKMFLIYFHKKNQRRFFSLRKHASKKKKMIESVCRLPRTHATAKVANSTGKHEAEEWVVARGSQQSRNKLSRALQCPHDKGLQSVGLRGFVTLRSSSDHLASLLGRNISLATPGYATAKGANSTEKSQSIDYCLRNRS